MIFLVKIKQTGTNLGWALSVLIYRETQGGAAAQSCRSAGGAVVGTMPIAAHPEPQLHAPQVDQVAGL